MEIAKFEFVGKTYICSILNGDIVAFRDATETDKVDEILPINRNQGRLLNAAATRVIEDGQIPNSSSILLFFFKFVQNQTEGKSDLQLKNMFGKLPGETTSIYKSKLRTSKRKINYAIKEEEEEEEDEVECEIPKKKKKAPKRNNRVQNVVKVEPEPLIQIKEEVNENPEGFDNNRVEVLERIQGMDEIRDFQEEEANGEREETEWGIGNIGNIERIEENQEAEEKVENLRGAEMEIMQEEVVVGTLAHVNHPMVENNQVAINVDREEPRMFDMEMFNERNSAFKRVLPKKRPNSDETPSTSSSEAKKIKMELLENDPLVHPENPSNFPAFPSTSFQMPTLPIPSSHSVLFGNNETARYSNFGNTPFPIPHFPYNPPTHLLNPEAQNLTNQHASHQWVQQQIQNPRNPEMAAVLAKVQEQARLQYRAGLEFRAAQNSAQNAARIQQAANRIDQPRLQGLVRLQQWAILNRSQNIVRNPNINDQTQNQNQGFNGQGSL